MDNLSMDVLRALELGYGAHYGAYKADYPNTREPEPVKPPDPKRYGVCPNCGNTFSRRGQKYHKVYCNDECRIAFGSRLKREAAERRKADGR